MKFGPVFRVIPNAGLPDYLTEYEIGFGQGLTRIFRQTELRLEWNSPQTRTTRLSRLFPRAIAFPEFRAAVRTNFAAVGVIRHGQAAPYPRIIECISPTLSTHVD
jgi:hypothetical protein